MADTPNSEIQLAHDIIENTDTNLFLTGKAGTGKTTFLKRLRKESTKRMVVLAPTGIAAINAGGVTIHSFFQLSFAPFIPGSRFSSEGYKMSKQKLRLIKSVDLLVIDEVSMVRADLLDAVDAALRRFRDHSRPFGGVQLLLIGDLQQLAPVVKDEEWSMLSQHYATPFFFASKALQQTNYATVELKTVYRQSDEHFLSLLNAIREGRADERTLAQLNARCIPAFVPTRDDGYIRLVTHNNQARAVNEAELEKLDTEAHTYCARVTGKFPEMSYPTEDALTLKVGAQVMFVKNDAEKRYYNGMIGEVVALSDKTLRVRPNGRTDSFEVAPEVWTNSRYAIDETTKEIKEEVEGEFTQIPLRLAWAITIHKSQGLTFDHVIIDASLAFAHGQTYVALSRCRTLQGIVLSAPLTAQSIITDATVETYNEEMRRRQPSAPGLAQMRQEYAVHLLTELFSFVNIRVRLASFVRLMEEHLYRIYPELTQKYKELLANLDSQIITVSARFAAQYGRMLGEEGHTLDDEALQDRVKKGAAYFYEQIQPLRSRVVATNVPIDNKDVKRRFTEALGELKVMLCVKSRLLVKVQEFGFDAQKYMKERAVVTLEEEGGPEKAKSARANARKSEAGRGVKVAKPAAQSASSSDIKNPAIFAALNAWRAGVAAQQKVPAYMVLQQKALMNICANPPATEAELLAVAYVGKSTVEKYGEDILKIVAEKKK